MFWLYMIIAIVVLLAVVIVVLALVAPKGATVERSIVVNVPPEKAFDYLRSLKNFESWSPWGKRDPDMQRGIRGTDGELGSVAWWKGNKQVGEGEQEVVKLESPTHIGMELRFLKPFKATNEAWFKLASVANGTKVSWGFHAVFKPPMNIMMMFMNMDKAIGKDYEEGLASLKKTLETA